MKNMMKIMLVVSMVTMGMVDAMGSRLGYGMGMLKNKSRDVAANMVDTMGVMKNSLKNNMDMGAGVAAGVAGAAAGADLLIGNNQNQTSQENSNNQSLRNWKLFDLGLSKGAQEQTSTQPVMEPVAITPVDYVQAGLQAITDQTDMNNKQIAALQAMEQTADVKAQIQDLEAQNIGLMAQADDLAQGSNRENVQDRQLEHYRQYTGRYQRGKDFLYDNVGAPLTNFGRGLSSYFTNYVTTPLANVWQGFTSLGVKDRFKLIVEGMRSMASSAAGLPAGAARQLTAAYKAMIAKIRRSKNSMPATESSELVPVTPETLVETPVVSEIAPEGNTAQEPNFAESGMM